MVRELVAESWNFVNNPVDFAAVDMGDCEYGDES